MLLIVIPFTILMLLWLHSSPGWFWCRSTKAQPCFKPGSTNRHRSQRSGCSDRVWFNGVTPLNSLSFALVLPPWSLSVCLCITPCPRYRNWFPSWPPCVSRARILLALPYPTSSRWSDPKARPSIQRSTQRTLQRIRVSQASSMMSQLSTSQRCPIDSENWAIAKEARAFQDIGAGS